MRMRELLFAAGAIGGVPFLCLLLLALSGSADTGPVAVAMAAVAAAALNLGGLWSRDLAHLAAGFGSADATPAAGKRPVLPMVRDVAVQAERLLGAQAQRATRAEQAYRAEQAVVENLPDPLV